MVNGYGIDQARQFESYKDRSLISADVSTPSISSDSTLPVPNE